MNYIYKTDFGDCPVVVFDDSSCLSLYDPEWVYERFSKKVNGAMFQQHLVGWQDSSFIDTFTGSKPIATLTDQELLSYLEDLIFIKELKK